MKIKSLSLFLLIAWFSSHADCVSAQTVAGVSQVLPFAATGTVTSGVMTVKIGETPITTSPGSTPIPTSTLSAATAGGKISTGADGAASLALGAGAEAGTARLGADSEVKVPETGEKNHSLEMLKGRLFLNISSEHLKQRGNSEFRLKTPAALLAVKGTKFFSSTKDGKDTIGVHEGSVEVLEPMTGQRITLIAGQAADVSPGILSARREMTDEERETHKTYDLADLSSTSLALFLNDREARRPWQAWFDGKLQEPQQDWLNWRRLNSSIWFQGIWLYGRSFNIVDQGVLQVRFPVQERDRTNKANYYTTVARWMARTGEQPQRDKIGILRKPSIPPAYLQSLRFLVRAKNIQSLRFRYETLTMAEISLDSPEGSWQSCSVPLSGLRPISLDPKSRAGADEENLFNISFIHRPQTDMSKPVEEIVVEMKDFRVLSLPQP